MEYHDEQGYKIKGKKLAHWKSILEEWLSLINRYCANIEDDAPYFYSERPNIGILSAAAWKAGFIALEEFAFPKRAKTRSRCDLWICKMDPPYKEDLIEAKQAWGIGNADSTMLKAITDVRKINRKEYYNRIGLIFLTQGIHKKYEQEMDNKIQELIKTSKDMDYDALSWVFPKNKRTLSGGGQYKNIYYPGVILLAKVAD